MEKKSTEKFEYKSVIATRKDLIDLLTDAKTPLTFDKIIESLNYCDDQNQKEGVSRRLRAMVRDGQLLQNRHGDFGISSKMNLIVGTVLGHPDGFGFLVREDGLKDLFIHFKQMKGVMHGDKVLAQEADFKGRAEAKIIDVLQPANKTLVARFVKDQDVSIGIPVNTRINHDVMILDSNNAKHDDMVLLEITQQPNKRFGPVGKVIEVLGSHLDPGMEIDVAMHAWGIPHVWPEEVQKNIGKIPAKVESTEYEGRVDLTDIPLITIDGEDSRDFDDAVWCQPTKTGWKVLVAIADVSHYVKPNTPLDASAQERSTSVYFPEHVVPMLPEALSNGICSLNPDVDRCTMVCEMLIGKDGKIKRSKFFSAIMRSHARLTYTQVGNLYENPNSEDSQQLIQKLPVLDDLFNLYKAMSKQRLSRGTLEFNTIETKIQFDSNKKIQALVPVSRNEAHKLIEELMVAANVCAGRFLTKHKIPGLYRVHEGPKISKIPDVRNFLAEFSLTLGGEDKPSPKDYAAVLQEAKSKPEFDLIQTVMLRSLTQAVYTPENQGHFGLAHDTYAHFTSPIRRYPDLLVHRAIRHILENKTKANYDYSKEMMIDFGIHCSITERRADDATRDVMDWLKCEFMQDKLGQDFSGKVSGVTSFGLFVRLNEVHVDGLVHISSLNTDYYKFDSVHHRLVGDSGANTYSMGDEIDITVARVSLDERKIDFVLKGQEYNADNLANSKKSKPKKHSNKNSKNKSKKTSEDNRQKPKKRKKPNKKPR